MNAIEIRNLTKNFGPKQAVNGLNMTVPEGAIYGFIGENGSGKSTTEKIICGLIHESGGSVKLYGRPHTDGDVRADMGVLIESPGCFPGLSVWNNMMIQAANLRIENAEREVVKVLKTVRMEGAAGNKYKNCSLGMKQRIGIAMALLGNPRLLILDEPVSGVDAQGSEKFYEAILNLKHNYHMAIAMVSHDLEIVREYADNVILINKTVLKSGPAKEVFESEEFKKVFFTVPEKGAF